MRDVSAVASKLRVVLRPWDRSALLFSPAAASRYGVVSTVDQQQGGGAGGGAAAAAAAAEPNGATAAGGAAGGGTAGDQHRHQQLSDADREVIRSLRDWDLWGPLVLCLVLAVALSLRAPARQSSQVFAAVFCVVWVGGTVVTVNAQLLGGTISFFQSVCVLGYSLFPLTLSALAVGALGVAFTTWWWVDLLLVAAGFAWAIRTSAMFVGLYVKPERRFLALYPVFFFYVFVSWLILLF
jgi:hypothetical protein